MQSRRVRVVVVYMPMRDVAQPPHPSSVRRERFSTHQYSRTSAKDACMHVYFSAFLSTNRAQLIQSEIVLQRAVLGSRARHKLSSFSGILKPGQQPEHGGVIIFIFSAIDVALKSGTGGVLLPQTKAQRDPCQVSGAIRGKG